MISDKKRHYANFKKIFPNLMEIIDDLIVIVSIDNNFKIEYVYENEFLERLGYLTNKLIGKSLLSILDFGDEIAKDVFLKRIQVDKKDLNVKIIKKNNEVSWAELKASSFINDKNEQKLIIRLRDISRTKELEKKLMKTEQKFKNITNKVPEIRFWDLFTPKKIDKALHISSEMINKTEIKFLTAIESLPFDFFLINKDGVYEMQNSICQKNWGDVVGKSPKDVAPDKDTLALWENNNSRAFSGEIVTGEVSFKINEEIRYIYNIITPVYIDDKIEYILGVNIDITDLKNTEKKLKESKERYRLIFENANDLIRIFDEKFKYEYFNEDVHRRVLGYSKDDLIGKSQLPIYHPEDRKQAILSVSKILRKGKGSYQARVRHKDGNYKWLEFSAKNFIDNKGNKKILSIARDITDRKEAEKKIKQGTELLEKTLYSLRDALFILDASNPPRIIDCNPAAEEIFEYTKKEMLSRPTTFLHINETSLRDFQQIFYPKVAEEGFFLNFEYNMKRKNGSIFPTEHSVIPLKDGNDKLIGWVSIVRDITERRMAEQKLIESEEQFRTIAEQSFMGIIILQDGIFKYYNEQARKLNGYSDEEIQKWKPYEFSKLLHPEDKDFVISQAKKKQIGDKAVVHHHKYRIITKFGEIRWIENFSKTISYKGKPADLIMSIDITDQKNANEKLRTSEEKYRHLYESSPNAILLINMKGKVIDCNRNSQNLSGFKKHEIVGKSILNAGFIPEKYIPKVIEYFKFLIKNKKLDPKIIQLYDKEGSLAWVSVQASIFPYENKEIIQVIIQNLTEEIKIKEYLKESEEKYHQLFETSPDGVILTDLKGNIIECNSSIKAIAGYPPDYFLGKNFMKLGIYYENGLEELFRGYEDLLGENRLRAIEIPIKAKNNQINWVQIRGNIIDIQEKRYILAVLHDISSQKRAEEVIKRNEEKYRNLLETSSVGVIEIDLIHKNVTYVNSKLLEIIGYSKQEILDKEFPYNHIIQERDLTKILRSNEEAELEFRITDKKGRLKWLSGKKIPNYNKIGEVASIRVWLEDITEKKMYESLIYELNVNFLNFTADIMDNIQLLLNTCLNLLSGDLILYINKSINKGNETYNIISSDNKAFSCDSEYFFEDIFTSALFYEDHDFPQTFFDIHKMKYTKTDPFISEYNLKGSFGKLIKSKDGFNSAVCVFYKKNPIISGQDKLVMFLICDAIEIEQRRWYVQKELEEQNITLNRINNLKSELFSRTSHELKTPLISIKGFTELLLTVHRSKLDTEIISTLEEIKEGAKRLENIINSLLESTKLEAGQLELNKSKEDLTFLIKFCIKELQGLAKLRNQTIQTNLHNKLETFFDKERIYEVISNLLVNAIKYTPSNGQITIQSEINKASIIISINDNGIGFTEEEKGQIFKQFGKIERYGQGWDVAIEGTGLGLFITKKLVELHGGKIWLESEGRNRGSTFYFSIPRK